MPKKAAASSSQAPKPKPKREMTLYQKYQQKNLTNSIYNPGTQQEKMKRAAARYQALKKLGILEQNVNLFKY
jgi:hypothetical protein